MLGLSLFRGSKIATVSLECSSTLITSSSNRMGINHPLINNSSKALLIGSYSTTRSNQIKGSHSYHQVGGYQPSNKQITIQRTILETLMGIIRHRVSLTKGNQFRLRSNSNLSLTSHSNNFQQFKEALNSPK
jgi:hypothetical protein